MIVIISSSGMITTSDVYINPVFSSEINYCLLHVYFVPFFSYFIDISTWNHPNPEPLIPCLKPVFPQAFSSHVRKHSYPTNLKLVRCKLGEASPRKAEVIG